MFVPNLQDEDHAAAFLDAVCTKLTEEGAVLVMRTAEYVSFRVPFWSMFHSEGRWPLRGPSFAGALDGGTITLAPRRDGCWIRYRFTMWRLVVLSTLLVVVGFGIMAPSPWPVVLAFWLWMVGGNYVLHTIRNRLWLRARVREALRTLKPVRTPHNAST